MKTRKYLVQFYKVFIFYEEIDINVTEVNSKNVKKILYYPILQNFSKCCSVIQDFLSMKIYIILLDLNIS